MLPVVWLVVSVVFLLIHLVPGDPIQQMLGEAATRHAYGLDLPLGRQYVNYWHGILHGDFGRSLRFNQNVGHIIAQAYPETMELTLAALAVALLLSIPAGVRSALHRNRWDDRALSFV
jgi:peptide/nickel transport system permease protein